MDLFTLMVLGGFNFEFIFVSFFNFLIFTGYEHNINIMTMMRIIMYIIISIMVTLIIIIKCLENTILNLNFSISLMKSMIQMKSLPENSMAIKKFCPTSN